MSNRALRSFSVSSSAATRRSSVPKKDKEEDWLRWRQTRAEWTNFVEREITPGCDFRFTTTNLRPIRPTNDRTKSQYYSKGQNKSKELLVPGVSESDQRDESEQHSERESLGRAGSTGDDSSSRHEQHVELLLVVWEIKVS